MKSSELVRRYERAGWQEVRRTGSMKMNSDSFAVKAGDAILTRPGSSHSLQQIGTDSLVVIINYPVK